MHKAQNLVEIVLLAGLVVVISIAAITMFNSKKIDLVKLSSIGINKKPAETAGTCSSKRQRIDTIDETTIETAGTFSNPGTSNGNTPSTPTGGSSTGSSGSSGSSGPSGHSGNTGSSGHSGNTGSSGHSGTTGSNHSGGGSGGGLSHKETPETAGVAGDVTKNPTETTGSLSVPTDKKKFENIQNGFGIN